MKFQKRSTCCAIQHSIMVSKTIKIVIGAIAIVAVIVAVALGIYFGTKGNLKLTIMDRCETYLKKNDLTR